MHSIKSGLRVHNPVVEDDHEIAIHGLAEPRRLRAAGISFEDREDLLGHKSGSITTHYPAVKLHNLVETANKVCDENSRTDNFES